MPSTSEIYVWTSIQGLEHHRLSTYEPDALCASSDGSRGAHYAGYHPPSPKADTQTYELTLREQCRRWNINRSPDDLCFYYLAQGNMPKCIITCQTEWRTLWALLLKKRSGYEASVGAQYFKIAPRPVLPDLYDAVARNSRDTPRTVLPDLQASPQTSVDPSTPFTAKLERSAARSVKRDEENAAERQPLDPTTIEKTIGPIITQAVSSITPIISETLTSVVKEMMEAMAPAVPTTINVCLANNAQNAGQSTGPTHGDCRPGRSSYESTATCPVKEASSDRTDIVAPGATLASRLLTGLETATPRLGAGGAAASIIASFLDSLQSELRNPSGLSHSSSQTDADANENAPPAEPLRDTSGRAVGEPSFAQRRTTEVSPTCSAASASGTVEVEDSVRGEQLSRSTSRSRSASDGPGAPEREGNLCKCSNRTSAQPEIEADTEEKSPCTSTLRAMSAESVDAAWAGTQANADSEESTLIDAFTEMLQKSREAGSRK